MGSFYRGFTAFVVALSVLPIATSAAADTHQLLVSDSPDRQGATALEGSSVSGDIYVFVDPDNDVKSVRFWVDDQTMSGSADKVENKAPFDLGGTNSDDTARPYNASALGVGSHTVTAEVTLSDGSIYVTTATFQVSDQALVFDQTSLSFSLDPDQTASQSVTVSAASGEAVTAAISDDATWLDTVPTSATTPASIQIDVDTTGLEPGNYSAVVTAGATGYDSANLTVTLSVGASYDLLVSSSPNRSAPLPADGETLAGDVYIFVSPETSIKRVRFYVDDPTLSGSPVKTESRAPHDLGGTAGDGTALPFDVDALGVGSHVITASIELDTGGSEVVSATITVGSIPALQFDQSAVSFDLDAGVTDAASVTVSTSDGSVAAFTLTESASWLTLVPDTGSTPQAVSVEVDSTGLVPGSYSSTVTGSAVGYQSASLTVTLNVAGSYDLMVSTSPDRSNAVPLEGRTVGGDIYVFTAPDTDVTSVDFYIDDPTASGTPVQTEQNAPYDLGGTAGDGTALPFDAATLADGDHTITAVMSINGQPDQSITSNFTVTSGTVPALSFDTASASFSVDPGGLDTASVGLSLSTGGATSFTVTDDADWLVVTPGTGTTPATLTLDVDSVGLAEGSYSATVSASGTDVLPDSMTVALTVGDPGCLPLTCEELLVDLPYALDFTFDAGKILDGAGFGTGFTYVQPTSNGAGYLPENLAVDASAGTFTIQTTAGLTTEGTNSQDNALGVGIDAASQVTLLSTSIIDPPAASGNYEQGGLWFGNDEDNFVKLTVGSTASGPRIEFLTEVGGVHVDRAQEYISDPTGRTVNLELVVDPTDQTISAAWSFDSQPTGTLGSATVPPEFFSFDAAGIDPRIGTRSFGGVFASHRNGPATLSYTFDHFTAVEQQNVDLGGPVEFDTVSYGLPTPTSMAWGPDGRLYVTELFGRIHALTFDANQQVIDDEVIDSLTTAWGGSRMTLGIEIDPASTPTDVILWVGHSDGSVNNGEANSGSVSRLSGTGFATVDDVITGLPRAIANHGLNSIHFGLDGRLYLAMGGNTGAGAPNDEATEFGPRPEQPLSAAFVVADVKAPDFQGQCASWVDDSTGTAEKTIPATCDVAPFATGLRNMYDFVFHTNGQIYGPDNGLGVKGTVPSSPTPDCQGIVTYGNGELDPDQQPDPLIRIEEGAYYGHPNPARDECVFKDGVFQGVAPLPNYAPPMANLGLHKSANGIIEYGSDLKCGSLQGNLLIANYSSGDDITRVVLSSDGLSVLATESLIGGFDDPLPLAQSPDGTIYVGELGSNQVTALIPADTGCWQAEAPAPADLLDVAGAAIDGLMYVVSGKTPTGPQSTVYTFDPLTDTWGTVADLPGPAVENPAVVAAPDGRLYAFGGSTDPFSGAVANASMFDPATGVWTQLSPMPTPRGGATAQELGGLIYVVGGMGADGASVDVVEAYDPATDTWSSVAPMSVRRDNPGSAVLNGGLYVFGGRTRNADGTELDGMLNSVEMFDPATGLWSARTAMPTGRRTFVTFVLNGRAIISGGEKTPSGGVFAATEEYDPVTDTWRALEPMATPRHGAAVAVIDGTAYVVGGGTLGGGSYSSVHESFSFASG